MTIGDNLTPMDTSGAYLGSGDLPQRKPPAMSRGAVAWVRDNLFSSIPNTIMTLLGFWKDRAATLVSNLFAMRRWAPAGPL
jgi:hypothetical protein